jgi:hypothetical protein
MEKTMDDDEARSILRAERTQLELLLHETREDGRQDRRSESPGTPQTWRSPWQLKASTMLWR